MLMNYPVGTSQRWWRDVTVSDRSRAIARGRQRRCFVSDRGRRLAFSLLEVILAIAILGGAMAVLGELVRVGTRSAQAARVLSSAQLVCDSLMAEIAAGISPAEPSDGILDNYDPQYQWQYQVEVESVDEQGLLAIRITVQEAVDPSSRPAQFSLTRWMIDPEVEAEQQALADELEAAAAEASASAGTTDAAAADGAAPGGDTGGGDPAGGGR